MHFDALLLSRPQFGVPVLLLIVFSSLALGLAGYVAVLEGLWLTTRTDAFLKLRSLWSRTFLVVFGIAALAVGLDVAAGASAPTWAAATNGFPARPAQLIVSALLSTALAVGAVSAARLWKGPDDVESCLALRMASGMLVICGPLEVALGDGARPRLIIGLALAAGLLGLWGGLLCWRGSPERSRLFLSAFVLMGPLAVLTPVAEWLGDGAALRL
ncbi:cytochrome ubiquinol oxidase subunit I [Phenylobacterium sp.]|uniref:cytochrome ubiquinol oxidase subunit I n=1 Tax=Phenylobacterium sp. TaxID=1871053 RepID=UPI002DE743BA|nr:cytochrome ubiquinol oxidase subunit I [Phenylobacterium sp.]